MSARTSLKKNYIYNVLYQMLIIIIPLITSPYLTRTIGADGLGVYSFTQSYAHYFVLFTLLGLANYGNREIARDRDDKVKVSSTFCEIYAFQLFMMVCVSTVYVITLVTVVQEDRIIYWLQFMYVLSAGFDINWCFFGLEKFKLTIIRNTVIKIVSAVAIFIFVHAPEDLWRYTLIVASSTLLSQLVVWPFLSKEIKYVKPTLNGIVSRIKPNTMLFLPVISVSLYTIMDKLMLGMMSTKAEVGYYAYAERIIQIPLALIAALGTVMLPRASNMLQKGKEAESRRLLVRSMQFAMLVSFGCMFGIMAIANDLIPWYYGNAFSRCASFTIWLSPVFVMSSWNNVIRTQFIIPKSLDKAYLCSVTAGALANLVMNSILIPQMEGLGAVIGTLIAQFVVCAVQFLLTKKQLDYKTIVSDTMVFCLIGLVMAMILLVLPDIKGAPIINILFQILVGIVIYCGLAMGYLIVARKDYSLVNSALSLLPGKQKRMK